MDPRDSVTMRFTCIIITIFTGYEAFQAINLHSIRCDITSIRRTGLVVTGDPGQPPPGHAHRRPAPRDGERGTE